MPSCIKQMQSNGPARLEQCLSSMYRDIVMNVRPERCKIMCSIKSQNFITITIFIINNNIYHQPFINKLRSHPKILSLKMTTFFYNFKLKMQKYKIVKTIGDGSYGIVFKALDPHNEVVAIKKMKCKYKNLEECNGLREIKCLKKLNHQNIVMLREVILANCQLYLVFDFLECNLYEVYTRAKENNRSLTENEIRSIFLKIATGLAYLHKNGFFHRDLKPENILCHNDDVKVCDFGLARQIRSRPPFTDYVSTRWYRAPQLLLRGSYNSPVDIFALACIIIELYMMSPLFPGQNEIQTMNKIVQILGTPTRNQWPQGYKMASTIHYNFPEKKKKQLSDLIPNASPQAIDLLQSMLSYSSRKRPSASQILKHQYFSSLHLSQQKPHDDKYQTKFSFYEKNIIQIPKNLPMQNSKQMEMRKSLIKFGSSFGSSFHLTKQEKVQRALEKQIQKEKSNSKKLEYILQNPKEEKKEEKPHSYSSKKKYSLEHHDQISKKFDQMEEILMELQKKQKDQKSYITQPLPRQQSKMQQVQIQPKMPVFTFGGIGVNSFSNLGSLKNVKSPIFLKSKLGQSK